MRLKHMAAAAALLFGLNFAQAQDMKSIERNNSDTRTAQRTMTVSKDTVKNTQNTDKPVIDTMRTYDMNEIVVTETPAEEMPKELRLAEIQKTSTTMYRGGLNRIIQNAGMQSQAPGFIPLVYANNIDLTKYGSFVIYGISVFGDPFYSYGIVSKFDGPFFSAPQVMTSGYPVRYVGLGVVNIDLKNLDDQAEIIHSPMKNSAIINKTIPNGNIGVYYERVGPIWWVENTWDELKVYPRSFSVQSVGSISTSAGRFKFAGFLWKNDGGINGITHNAQFDIKQNSEHSLLIAGWDKVFSNKLLGDFIIRAKFGRENWSNNANQNVSDSSKLNYAGNNLDVGVNAITGIVQVENKNYLLGLEHRVLSDSRNNEKLSNIDFLADYYKKYTGMIDDEFSRFKQEYANLENRELPDTAKMLQPYADSLRNMMRQYAPYIDSLHMALTDSLNFYYHSYDGLTQKQKARKILDYMKVAEEKYKEYYDTLSGDHNITIKNPTTGKDTVIVANVDKYLAKIPDFRSDENYLKYKKTLELMLQDDRTADQNSIHMTTIYLEGKIPLFEESTILESSIGANRLSYGGSSQLTASGSLKLTKKLDPVSISLYASKNSAAVERNNLNAVLRNRTLDGIESRIYSVTTMYHFGSDFLEDIKLEYLHKYFSKNSSEYDAYSKELDVTLRNIARLSYQLTAAIGGANERESQKDPYHSMLGSINTTVNLVLSWNVLENFNVTSNLRWHDGYQTDRTVSGNFEKSSNALYLDLGLMHTFKAGKFAMESSVSCMNILAIKAIGRENEVYRVVILNPVTKQLEVKNFNALALPNFEIKFTYAP